MFQAYLSDFSEKNGLKFQEVLQISHFLLGGEVFINQEDQHQDQFGPNNNTKL